MKARIYAKNISYIISVSVGTGCYRHLRISGCETLNDLAEAILRAFDFDNDHLLCVGPLHHHGCECFTEVPPSEADE